MLCQPYLSLPLLSKIWQTAHVKNFLKTMDPKSLLQKFTDLISQAKTPSQLAKIEQKAFSRKSGEITKLMHTIKSMTPVQKKSEAPQLQTLQKQLKILFTQKSQQLQKPDSTSGFFDPTLPSKKPKQGRLHPITQVLNEIEDFFSSLGFIVFDGPEVDSTFFNFEAVNIPKDHPARDMQDTFYLDPETVLRTHTSNCQVRAMQKFGAPLRAIVPGRVFRNEDRDARHEHTFTQFEGIMIDRDISIANFRDIMDQFFKKFLDPKTEVRIRPGYFPFVEPGFEVDFKCTCGGEGCGLCKGTGWVEFGGAGMIHPNVLKAGGIDPKKFSGWAFGCSPERLLCIRHNIPDLRLFRSGDLRFLDQF